MESSEQLTPLERNFKHLRDFLSHSESPEAIADWLDRFDHLKQPDFAGFFFEHLNEALEVFREPEVKEPTRIQLQSFPSQSSLASTSGRASAGTCQKEKEPRESPVTKSSPRTSLTAKSSPKTVERKSPEVPLDVNDSQAFPSLGDSLSQSSTKKRITPRRVATKAVHGNAKFIKSNYSLTENRPENGFNDVRNELKIKRSQESSKDPFNDSFKVIKEEPKIVEDSLKTTEVEQVLEQSQKSQISALSSMFVDFLQKSLFCRPANFNDLLLVIIQILNRDLKVPLPVPDPEVTLFKAILVSPSACFHFAYLVFDRLFIAGDFLYVLSKPALLSICLNSRLLAVCDSLPVRIERILEHRTQELQRVYSRNSGIQEFVPYDVDADSSGNFPNSQGFSQFRKQRDCFNSLLQAYYSNTWRLELTNDDKAMFTFINRIHATMASKSYFRFNNFSMLAKLFVEQLLRTCNLEQQTGSLTNGLKFELLENRFKKSSNSSDPFNGFFRPAELFFKDFIFYGDSSIFNQHLVLALKNRLKEAQNQLSRIFFSDSDDSEEEFVFCVENILLLSKFIGFLDFYPFYVGKEANGKVVYIENQAILRQDWNPNLEILEILVENFHSGNQLFIYIPAIVQYLHFADVVTFRLEKIQHSCFLLAAIYKFCLPKIVGNSKFPLGRQFLQQFLERFFFTKALNPDSLIENPTLLSLYLQLLINLNTNFQQLSAILDRNFHPFLMSNVCDGFSKAFQEIFERKNKQTVKSVQMLSFPISSSGANRKSSLGDRLPDVQIQEALISRLFQHSKTIKSSYEFFLDSCHKSSIGVLAKRLQGSKPDVELSKFLKDDFETIFNDKSTTFRHIMQDSGYSNESTDSVIDLSKQLVTQQIEGWLTKRLFTGSGTENRTPGRKDANDGVTRLESERIAAFFEHIRRLIPRIRRRDSVDFSVDSLESIIQDYSVIRQLPDPSVIDRVFIDFFFTVLAMKPEMLTSQLISKVIALFPAPLPVKVITQCVIIMIEQSPRPEVSWQHYETFLLGVLRARKLDFEYFQNAQVVPLLKIEWQDMTRRRLSSILDRFVKTGRELKIVGDYDNIVLDWMAWSLNDDHDSEL